jgi:hypothetical protein
VAGAQADVSRKGVRGRRYARIPHFGRVPARITVPGEKPVAPPVAERSTGPEPLAETQTHWLAWAGVAAVLGSAAVIAAAFGLHW